MGNLKSQKSNGTTSLECNHSSPTSSCFGFELGSASLLQKKRGLIKEIADFLKMSPFTFFLLTHNNRLERKLEMP